MKKIRLFLIVLALAVLLAACDNISQVTTELISATSQGTTSENTSGISTTQPKELLVIAENGKSDYKVVTRLGESVDVMDTVKAFIREIEVKTGATLTMSKENSTPSQKEIIIGLVPREEAKVIQNELFYTEYSVKISESKIIVTAFNPDLISKAVEVLSGALEEGEPGIWGIDKTFEYEG